MAGKNPFAKKAKGKMPPGDMKEDKAMMMKMMAKKKAKKK